MRINKTEFAVYALAAALIFVVPLFIKGSSLERLPKIQGAVISDKKTDPLIKPRLIYFWAEWCGICKMMQNPISAVLNDYAGITVAVKSGNDRLVKNYLSQQRLDWVVINDKQGEIARQYEVNGVPAVFILDPEGEIAFATSGYNSEWGLRLRLWLAQ